MYVYLTNIQLMNKLLKFTVDRCIMQNMGCFKGHYAVGKSESLLSKSSTITYTQTLKYITQTSLNINYLPL